MARKVSIADVDQAEADLAAAKKGKDPARKQAAANALAEVRSAYRTQEEEAGRRSGLVGGDATSEG
jgi:hypothetical protein